VANVSVKQVGREPWAKWYIQGLGRKRNSWIVGPEPEKAFLREVTKSVGLNKTLLDIGCGAGKTVKLIAPKVREAWGIDPSKRLIEFARENAPQNARFKVADGRKLPFEDGSFHVVICQRGPATDNERFAREMQRVLKKDGAFIAITIGERDKENIKKVFGRGQLYKALLAKKTEAKRHIALLKKLRFARVGVREYNPVEYFAKLGDLIFRLERTPIIPNFRKVKDKRFLKEIERRFFDGRGIRTNSHRLIVKAIK